MVIKLTQFVQQFQVTRIFFEQSAQGENPNLRPARRHRRFFQRQIGLPIVWLLFQDLFDHFHCALRCFFGLALRFHYRDRGGRNVEKTFFARFLFRDFGPAQQLASGQKLRLLLQDSLQKRNRVAEIAQFDRGHRFQPKAALRFVELFFGFNGHLLSSRACGRSISHYNKSSCGFCDCGMLFVDRRFFFSCPTAPFGFSRCARISFARSKISFGKPASRATWIP